MKEEELFNKIWGESRPYLKQIGGDLLICCFILVLALYGFKALENALTKGSFIAELVGYMYRVGMVFSIVLMGYFIHSEIRRIQKKKVKDDDEL